jgi:hypothetical protein
VVDYLNHMLCAPAQSGSDAADFIAKAQSAWAEAGAFEHTILKVTIEAHGPAVEPAMV